MADGEVVDFLQYLHTTVLGGAAVECTVCVCVCGNRKVLSVLIVKVGSLQPVSFQRENFKFIK